MITNDIRESAIFALDEIGKTQMLMRDKIRFDTLVELYKCGVLKEKEFVEKVRDLSVQ